MDTDVSSAPLAPASRRHWLPVSLVTSLFFCWGLTNNLLPVLIPKLKNACQLSNTQSMFVDVANWMAYFLMAVPTAMLMRRFGYKAGIIAGLLVAAAGCLLFVPAANVARFPVFLIALFVTASGMVFLETAANPYIAVLGDPATASFRLNVSQSFNGLGAVVAALWLSKVIIRPETMSEAAFGALDPLAQRQHLLDQAALVIPPYLGIAGFLACLAVVFMLITLPEIKEPVAVEDREGFKPFRHPLLVWGVIAQFFYVGAQVGVDATFLNYTREVTGLSLYDATTYLGLILGCFFLGRVAGTAIMSRVSPAVLLGAYAVGVFGLLAACALVAANASAAASTVSVPGWLGLGDHLVFTSHVAPYLVMGVKFLMSIMFPTIFSLALRGLGAHTKMGSSFLVMSIVGGALIPLLLGRIADATGSFQPAYWALAACMGPVLIFAAKARRVELTAASPSG